MRLFAATLAGWCVLAGAVHAQNPAASTPAAGDKNADNAGSYAIGLNLGRGLKDNGVEVNLDSLVQGVRDALQGAQPRYTEEQLHAALDALGRAAQAHKQLSQQSAGEKNKREGEAFLAGNKTKAGVTATSSGLQYQILRSGTGATPKATDTVKVHYEGTLLDGKVFDSSIKRNEPAVFPVNGVIAGWTEAMQLMKVGDKWRLFIPAELAYGGRGAGNVIGPNAVLIFDVELLDIVPPQPAR
jgi:FKBP-type peptidyl-prolyl cis-trans isomerase FklB